MRAVFRTDASTALGGGHLMRCLTLAEALESLGWQCGFAVNDTAMATVPALVNKEHRVIGSGVADEALALAQFWPDGVDWLIVDHYGLDASWERRNRGWTRKILVLDDLADREHDCDLLLDQTLGRRAEDYANLVANDCRLLLGPDYALLRPSFARLRSRSLARRKGTLDLKGVAVSLGATDPENFTLTALEGVARSGLALEVDVFLGSAAPHQEAVRRRVSTMGDQVGLHIDAADMPALMAQADLAIGAAGTSTWERCCLGLPTLMLVLAENQRHIAEAISNVGAAQVISGPNAQIAERIASALQDFAADRTALATLSAVAAEICDGRGSDRLALELVAPGRATDGRLITLRLAKPHDEKLILTWQQHPTTRRFSRNPKVPTGAEHQRWFKARLADPDCLLTLIVVDDTPAGVLRLDPLPKQTTGSAPVFEISILVSPDYRGLGVASEALWFARRWRQNAIIVAEVLPGNEASAALFAAAGYQPGPDGMLYSYPQRPETASEDQAPADKPGP